MPPREAFLGPQEPVAFADAVGRLAAESLATYPPGHPERAARRAVDAGDARLHPRGGRARRLGPGRRRSQPAHDPSGGRVSRAPAWGVDSEHGTPPRRPPLPAGQLPLAADERHLAARRWRPGTASTASSRPGPARRAGRRLRGGRRPLPPPGARPGASLPGVRPRLERDDAAGRGRSPSSTQWWRRGEYAAVIRFYQENGIPIRGMITRRAPSRVAT